MPSFSIGSYGIQDSTLGVADEVDDLAYPGLLPKQCGDSV